MGVALASRVSNHCQIRMVNKLTGTQERIISNQSFCKMSVNLGEASLETMFEPLVLHARSVFNKIGIFKSNLKVLLDHFE